VLVVTVIVDATDNMFFSVFNRNACARVVQNITYVRKKRTTLNVCSLMPPKQKIQEVSSPPPPPIFFFFYEMTHLPAHIKKKIRAQREGMSTRRISEHRDDCDDDDCDDDQEENKEKKEEERKKTRMTAADKVVSFFCLLCLLLLGLLCEKKKLDIDKKQQTTTTDLLPKIGNFILSSSSLLFPTSWFCPCTTRRETQQPPFNRQQQ